MGRDRSLDEFFSPSDDDSDEEAADERSDAPSTDAERPEPEDDADRPDESGVATESRDEDESHDADRGEPTADQPRATYRWSPDGDDCPGCGTRVNARWRDGDRFVCADCKEW